MILFNLIYFEIQMNKKNQVMESRLFKNATIDEIDHHDDLQQFEVIFFKLFLYFNYRYSFFPYTKHFYFIKILNTNILKSIIEEHTFHHTIFLSSPNHHTQ